MTRAAAVFPACFEGDDIGNLKGLGRALGNAEPQVGGLTLDQLAIAAVLSLGIPCQAFPQAPMPAAATACKETTFYRYTGQMLLTELTPMVGSAQAMYHYKAHIYSAGLGRSFEADPIGTGDGANLYAYVGNGPMNLSDP